MNNPFIKKARAKEEEAYRLEQGLNVGARKLISSGLSKAYLDAGDEYLKANDIQRARSNYKDALKVAPEKNRVKIEGMLEGLGTASGRELNLFSGVGYVPGKFAWAYLAIVSFLGALLFISFDLTGNIVLGKATTNLSFLAIGLFVLGLMFVFFYFKNKK